MPVMVVRSHVSGAIVVRYVSSNHVSNVGARPAAIGAPAFFLSSRSSTTCSTASFVARLMWRWRLVPSGRRTDIQACHWPSPPWLIVGYLFLGMRNQPPFRRWLLIVGQLASRLAR